LIYRIRIGHLYITIVVSTANVKGTNITSINITIKIVCLLFLILVIIKD